MLLAIADIANDAGIAWPGAGDEGWLASKARITGRGVRKILHEKLEVGDEPELSITARPGKSNLYHVSIELLDRRRALAVQARAEQSSGVRALSEGESLGSNDGSAEPAFRGPPEPAFRGVDSSPQNPQADGEERSVRGKVYDALVEACYPEGATLTAKEKRKVGIAAVEIDRANGTAEDVVERVARYRAHVTYGGVALTAMSLANHWAELAPPGAKRTTAPCPECEVGGGLHSADCSRAA